MNWRGSSLWVGYLLLLAPVSILLLLIKEADAPTFHLLRDLPPPPPHDESADFDSLAAHMGSSDIYSDPFVPPAAVAGPTSQEMLADLARNHSWASSVRTLLDDIAGYGNVEWKPPPAGQTFEGFPTVEIPDASDLDFVPGTWTCEIPDANTVESGTLKLVVQNAWLSINIGPGESAVQPIPRDGELELYVENQVKVPVFFGHRLDRIPITDVRQVSVGDILRNGVLQLDLNTLPQAREPFGDAMPGALPIRVRFRPGGPTDLSPSIQGRRPVVAEQGSQGEPFSGEINYRRMRALEHVLVRATTPYQVSMVWSTKADLRQRLVCLRADTGEPVGRFVGQLPFFVAASDGRTSLLLSLFATSPDDDFDFHVQTVSAAHDPRKLAFLQALADLPLSGPHGPVTKTEADDAVRSLAQVLDVNLDDADLTFIRSLGQDGINLANYLAHLANPTSPAPHTAPEDDRGNWTDFKDQYIGNAQSSWTEKIKTFNAAFAYSTSAMDNVPAARANSEPFDDSLAEPEDLGYIIRGWRCAVAEAAPSPGVFRLLLSADDQTLTPLTDRQPAWVPSAAAVRDGAVALSLEWYRPGQLFSAERRVPLSDAVSVPVDRLAADTGFAMNIPVLPDAGRAFNLTFPASVNVRLDACAWSGAASCDTVALSPHRPGNGTWSERYLSFMRGQTRAAIPVLASERFLGVAAVGDAALRGRVIIRRSDTGQPVGTYAPDLPVLLAVADGRTSLEVDGVCPTPPDALGYRVLALAAPEDPRKALFFETLAQLTEVTRDGIPASKHEIDRTVLWMLDALAIEFSRDELREAHPNDETVAGLFRYLDDLNVLR